MIPLAGYANVRRLRASSSSQVYVAQRSSDGARVVAKVFDIRDEATRARVEHELHLLEQLGLEEIVRPRGIERSGDQLVLLLDYIEGQNLAEYAAGRALELDEFLRIATRLASTLAKIHAQRVVHRDIKPSNILVEAETGTLYIADFGISVLLENQRRLVHDPDIVTGTLPYISPEQTGRTRREVDVRSDLYSLGVTFYELLTGARPFTGDSPLQLIHAHLAQRAQPPIQLRPELPALLSELVMKLLEKAPEHRYQSARGLLADLERLARALREPDLAPNFTLGSSDYSATLLMPHRLYGRERERKELLASFAALRARERPRVMLLSGAPGQGKSALIDELAGPLSSEGGHLILAKFELDAREVPYAALVRAFNAFFHQLLTRSELELARWRARLRRGLGGGGIAAALVELIEPLGLILGPVETAPELELSESRNRLHLALERMLSTIAEAGPLVLVIDDLQWSDAASSELLAELLPRPSLGPVLFVLAYRNGEIRADHPTLASARELHAPSLELAPLAAKDVEDILIDLLGQSRERVAPLAELLARKTDNNPLFIRQFLVHLGELELLRPGPQGWTWELEAIARAGIPDDVLGVLASKLERLPAIQQRILGWAACQGASFELGLLEATGAELEPVESVEQLRARLVASLYALERAGLVLTRDASTYQFAHDRLQEAARATLSPRERGEVHARLARALVQRAHGEPQRGSEELAFPIVEQLEPALDNLGLELTLARVELELEQLIACFGRAGQRALDTGGWLSARRYFERGHELLQSPEGRAGLDTKHELAFSICFGRALAVGLSGEADAEAEAFEALEQLELSAAARARIAARRAELLALRRRDAAGFRLACAALAELGVEIPERISPPRMLAAALRTQLQLRGLELDDLLALPQPDPEDRRSLAMVSLLTIAGRNAFATSPLHFAWLLALQARMLLKLGAHPGLIEGLAQYAIIAARLFGVESGRRLSELVRSYAEALELPQQRLSRVRYPYAILIAPLHRPYAELHLPNLELLRFSLEAGDRLNAGQAFAPTMGYRLASGMHLRELLNMTTQVGPGLPGAGQLRLTQLPAIRVVIAFAETLGSRSTPPQPGFFQITGKASRVERAAAITYEGLGWLLLGDYARAFEVLEPIAHRFERDSNGMWVCAEYATFGALAAAERVRSSESLRERARLRKRIRKQLRLLRRWARNSPENYGPGAELSAGELARLDGRPQRALEHFERARELAGAAGTHHIEGLCCERLAALADEQGWTTIATNVRAAGRRAYARWGAHAVLVRFDEAYPELRELDATFTLTTLSASASAGSISSLAASIASSQTGSAPASQSSTSHVLDFESLLATSRALSEELRLEEVIRRVLASAIENAGADRGLVLLERGGELALVAEGDAHSCRERVADPLPLAQAGDRLAVSLVRYVSRTGNPLVLDDAREDSRFCTDPYIVRTGVPSLLCTPLRQHGELVALVVLENHLGPRAFTRKRVEVLDMVLSQAGNALQNARLFARLELSELRWRTLANGVPDLIVVLDRHGLVEITNGASELDGQDLEAIIAPEDHPNWLESFQSVLASGELHQLELRLALDPTDPRWHIARLTPLSAAHQRGRVLAVFTDMHERRMAEQAKAALEAQLRQQQRLESIGTLASGVAHEINNPVQGIMNYAELLRDGRESPEVVEEFAGEIVHEAERVTGIVRGLLTFARQEPAASLEPTSAAQLVDASLLLLTTLLRKDGITLDTTLAPELPLVACRPQQIQQIIMNLITNARDALVGAELPRERRQLELSVRTREFQTRTWVRFSVRDQGTGIPPEVQAHIFDPFFTTKGRDKGTGLGLAISHGIASEHGGQLSFETIPDEGTVFHLDLPAHDAHLSRSKNHE